MNVYLKELNSCGSEFQRRSVLSTIIGFICHKFDEMIVKLGNYQGHSSIDLFR
jgi:hypothetical protein